MSRYRVKKGAIIFYGEYNRAYICIRPNQIWELKNYPDEQYPWYSLARDCIIIGVLEDDFKRLFEEIAR